MRLKKLEIIGFKSFADKTTLEFGEGITAIVGPNGCGKSNIADAFRWVLGEQSAKSMRGDKMHDVIFAGASRRQPLNFAEVTITLTDIKGSLPIDYNEVAITRRLHRNGESSYLLNKHPVRLKDIQDMFLDSGMGKNAFSIFEQGKIDQIIHYTPLERRSIFEETAGILRFLQKKREALRKLDDVDLNLSRIKDIALEVEKQITILEQQAEQARIYKENKQQLDQFEKALLVCKWDNLQRRSGDAHKRKEHLSQQVSHAMKLMVTLETKLSEAQGVLQTNDQVLRSKHEDIIKKRSEKTIKLREQQSHEERYKELVQKEQRWQQELASASVKRTDRHKEADQLQKQQQEFEKSFKQQEQALLHHREGVRQLENRVHELRSLQQKTQQERLKVQQAESHAESLLKQHGIRQENYSERQMRLQERQKSLSTKTLEVSKAIDGKKQEVDGISKQMDCQKAEMKTLDSKLHHLQSETARLQKMRDQSQQEIAEARARQKVLLRLREEMVGFSAGSKRLLQEALNPKSPLYQRLKPLHDCIIPQNGSEETIAAVLRVYSQTLVAETRSDLEATLTFAKEQKIKDFSLACQETWSGEALFSAKPHSLLNLAVDNPTARHFLQNALSADTSQHALQLAKQHPGSSIWSNEGLFIDPQGVIFHTTTGENNVFLREAEIKTLDGRLNKLEKQYQEQANLLTEAHQTRAEIDKERNDLDKNMRREEMRMAELNFSLQRLHAEHEQFLIDEKQIESELHKIDETLKALSTTITELSSQQTTLKLQVAECQKEATVQLEEIQSLSNTLKKDKDALLALESQCRKTLDDYKKASHTLQILEVKDQENQQQEQRLTEEILASQEMQKQFKNRAADALSEVIHLDAILNEYAASYASLEQSSAMQKNSISDLEKEWQLEQNQCKPWQDELQKIEIQIAQLAATSQGITQEAHNRYELTIDEARKVALDAGITLPRSIENTEQRIRQLRQELEKVGNVNLSAIEEFEKNQTRHAFLNQQIADLESSKQELLHIITQLDTESRKLFKQTVEAIRVNFKKNFEILFNGGEADLQMTESADILEAGIEIVAKPPGKQMRSIQLMSGGEKCLTSMALLFAIFEVKPAPFCILDEIDAPLDETNVERFLNVVKQFVDRCQFISITHNKRTMAAANVLFGVSMEEKGVSKLLTMAFASNLSEKAVVSVA